MLTKGRRHTQYLPEGATSTERITTVQHDTQVASCYLRTVVYYREVQIGAQQSKLHTQVLFRTQCCSGSYLWRTTAGSCYHLDIANYCASDSVLSCIWETLILRLS